MSEIKLLPCPFCGGEAVFHTNELTDKYYVTCCDCGCRTADFKYPEEAIAQWNTRKPMERIVKNLEHLCKQTYYKSVDGDYMAGARNNAYHNAIQVVKEEGGIE